MRLDYLKRESRYVMMSSVPILLLAVSGFLTVIGFLSRFGWWFDLACHFRTHYLLLQLLCLLLCIPNKRRKLAAVIFCFAILNLSVILPLYMPASKSGDGTHNKLSVLLLNVNTDNTAYEKTVSYIRERNPDIFVLQEINGQWLHGVGELLKDYPHQKFVVREDNFGIGLFSRAAPVNAEVKYFGTAGVPSLLAEFSFSGHPVTLLATHPLPPKSLAYFNWRNEQLLEIASRRSQWAERMILVGDLNTTSWSFHFQEFLRQLALKDSRQGFGLQSSWPAGFPLRITLDHILVSDEIQVLHREIGEDIFSDHYPVYVELGI